MTETTNDDDFPALNDYTTMPHEFKVWPQEDIGVVEFAEEGQEINLNEEEMEVYVAIDSGACAHIAPKEAMPNGTTIRPYPAGMNKNMVAANGGTIDNYGLADVELVNEEGRAIGNTFMVADITRPLHATGQICDTGKEVLLTAKGAAVVRAGTLSRHFRDTKILAKYQRRGPGGLYMGKFKVRVPRKGAKSKDSDGEAAKPSFIPQGAKR